jgi:hypothetical protein
VKRCWALDGNGKATFKKEKHVQSTFRKNLRVGSLQVREESSNWRSLKHTKPENRHREGVEGKSSTSMPLL